MSINVKYNTMENSDENCKQRKNSDTIPFSGDILQSLGIRRTFKMANGYNWQLLVFNFYFLPCVSVLFYLIFLLV